MDRHNRRSRQSGVWSSVDGPDETRGPCAGHIHRSRSECEHTVLYFDTQAWLVPDRRVRHFNRQNPRRFGPHGNSSLHIGTLRRLGFGPNQVERPLTMRLHFRRTGDFLRVGFSTEVQGIAVRAEFVKDEAVAEFPILIPNLNRNHFFARHAGEARYPVF